MMIHIDSCGLDKLINPKSKIILIQPKATLHAGFRAPLNLLQLAAALPEELYDVHIIDCHIHEPELSELAGITDGALMVGISAFTGLQSAEAIKIAGTIKQINPEMKIIWGGYHPSIWADLAIASPLVDCVAVGAGESAIVEIADELRNNQKLDKKKLSDKPLKEIPSPGFDLTDIEQYLASTLIGKRVASINTSYGCIHNCSFCAVAKCFQNKWIAKPPEQVVDEIEYLWRSYKIDALEFSDNAPFIDNGRMLDIAESILKAEIKIGWMSMARVDELLEYSTDELKTLIDSGFSRVFVGIESGDQSVLDKINKNQNTDQYLEFALRCAKHGLIPDYSFTLGYPSSTDHELNNTFELIRKLKRITPSSAVMLYQYTPYFELVDAPNNLEFPQKWEEWGSNKWRDYSLTGFIKPWMTPAQLKRIRDFETVLTCRFYKDEKVFPQTGRCSWLINSLVSQAKQRWHRELYSNPYELRLLRRSFLTLNPGVRRDTIAT